MEQDKKIVLDMPNADYHAHRAVSKSRLDMIDKDPCAVEWANVCPQDEEKLKTFDFGDAMHAICLEPERLKSEFIMAPTFNLRTNAGKEEKAQFEKENEGKKILAADEHKKLTLMFESVMAHPEARKLIEADGIAESSYFWTDSETGLECKCRPDKQIGSRLVDVKTTPDLAKFCYSVEDFRYHVQDPWYCDGVANCGVDSPYMEFLVIQKTISIGRYPVMVVRLPEEAIEYGRMLYRRDLQAYADFLEHGKPCTTELQMHYRFMNEAVEAIMPEIRYE
jgi:exodeoxyribonuclease VIII